MFHAPHIAIMFVLEYSGMYPIMYIIVQISSYFLHIYTYKLRTRIREYFLAKSFIIQYIGIWRLIIYQSTIDLH